MEKEDIFLWGRRKTDREKRTKYLENENFSFGVGGIYLENKNTFCRGEEKIVVDRRTDIKR